jgi:tetratricopeptide (TPR) repeat protein
MRRALFLLLLTAGPAWVQPALAQAASGQSAAPSAMDQLLSALKAAPDEQTAAALEAHIEQGWIQAGTPAVTLLMQRAVREARGSSDQDALDDFDAALDLDPNQAEAWHRKALVHYHMGDVNAAIADIGQALRLQPRDFAALQTLSRIAEARNDWKGAYAAWQKVLEIDPKTPDGQQRLRDLRRHALGPET